MHPNLSVATGQSHAAVAVRPLQVKDAVYQSTVLGHHLRLPDTPTPTQANVSPSIQPSEGASCPTSDAPGSVRLPPPDRSVVVSLHRRLDSRVDNHELPELGAEGHEMPVSGLFAELEVVGGRALGAREGPRARQPQHEIR